MKRFIILMLAIPLWMPLRGQTIGPYSLAVEEVSMDGLPRLHSFAHAQYSGKWIWFGGRTDGLHRRQPWAAFWATYHNRSAFVIDPVEKKVQETSLHGLLTTVYEQLQSSNMQFYQLDSLLILVGGYGYSKMEDEHITYPFLTLVDLQGLVRATGEGRDISPYFWQIRDERMRVTGGQLGMIGDFFYLVGGQNFEGRYNPMGPGHGPGFFQEYTNEIRLFRLKSTEDGIELTDYRTWRDTAGLHRRDFNLVPQVFADGEKGLTAFSGVFRYDEDLPWLSIVDITAEGYRIVPHFNQYLNQYHTAKLPIHDSAKGAMHTVFFGGISQFFPDGQNRLVNDPNVPFVRTISVVTRHADGTMSEAMIGEMPALLGSGAAFIPSASGPFDSEGILLLADGDADTIEAGYIFGGIESSAPNILFSDNDGSLSAASNRIFAVRLVRGASVEERVTVDGDRYFNIELGTDRETSTIYLSFDNHKAERVEIALIPDHDDPARVLADDWLTAGHNNYEIDISDLPPGPYRIRLDNREFTSSASFQVK